MNKEKEPLTKTDGLIIVGAGSLLLLLTVVACRYVENRMLEMLFWG